MLMKSLNKDLWRLLPIIGALLICFSSFAENPTTRPSSSTEPTSPVSLSVFLPASRLTTANFGAPILVEWKASNQFVAAKKVCLSVRSKELFDRWVEGLGKPPADPQLPDEGDGLWLTYRSIEKVPGHGYLLEYVRAWEFVSIEPGKTGYAKFGLVTRQIPPGKIELQAHLIVNRKVIATSPPVEVPLDDPGQ
jgi:hypothetical protein